MSCLCGHAIAFHMKDRGRCTGDIRIYIQKVPQHVLRPGDRILEKHEAEVVVNEAAAKVDKAPSYEKQFKAMMKRRYVSMNCQCRIYHEIEIPSEETGITLYAPDGSALRHDAVAAGRTVPSLRAASIVRSSRVCSRSTRPFPRRKAGMWSFPEAR